MNKPRLSCVTAVMAVATIFAAYPSLLPQAAAQNASFSGNAPVQVDRSVTRIELITGTSRLLEFGYDVPELVVDNQSVIRATPIAANQVLLTALKPGIAAITVSDANKKTQTINVLVGGDVRALEMKLQQIFPNSAVRATALETGVVLSGTLARADQVPTVLSVASEYFPRVHNAMQLPDSQMIAIEVQVYEVARSKVRSLGIDWQLSVDDLNLDVFGGQNVFNSVAFSVVENGDRLDGFLQALESRNLAKLLDRPTIVTMNGRPAEFLEGGELPFEVSQGLGSTTIEFRPFGTKLDVVPIVQGEGSVRLEIRAEVSEPSTDLANDTGTPGFRVRRVNTGVDMKIGHTLALAGDIREEIEAQTSGIPWLMNTPYVGSLFRRVQETKSEIELVILLTPRFVGEMDPALLPPGRPGRGTVSPSDCQLYHKSYLEVPRCGPDCGHHMPNQPREPVPGENWQYAPGYTQGQPAGAQPNYTISDSSPAQPAASAPTPSATPATAPRSPAPTAPSSSYDWIQDPTKVETPNGAATPGFGFPGQPNLNSAQPTGPKTSNLPLKNLFRR